MSNPDILIIGAGPAGYVCAIRLGQLGKKVLVVDKDKIGGVCLNRGCIPTKALLHYTQILSESNYVNRVGIKFSKPEINLFEFNQHIQNIPTRLRKGIEYLFNGNNVGFLQAQAKFQNKSTVVLLTPDGKTNIINPKTIIIATGSRNTTLPNINPDQEKIITSDEALIINDIPKSLVIIGAGAIGLEFATIYNRLGSKVRIIEIMPQILPGSDIECANQLTNILKKQGIELFLNTKVSNIVKNSTIQITATSNEQEQFFEVDKILLAVGRTPNTDDLNLDETDIKLDHKKYIKVNNQFQTSIANIYAIGDVIGPPLLAHKAMAQGVYLAEKICNINDMTIPKLIPNCIYTDPELASIGLTDAEAKSLNYEILIGKVPLSAIGRAHTLNRIEGFVKIIVDKKTDKVLGTHILSPEASNLINEFTLAINSGLTINKIVDTVHPHPTLSETVQEAAAAVHKKAIHILNK